MCKFKFSLSCYFKRLNGKKNKEFVEEVNNKNLDSENYCIKIIDDNYSVGANSQSSAFNSQTYYGVGSALVNPSDKKNK